MRDTTPRVGFVGPGLVVALLTMIAALLLMGALPNTALGQARNFKFSLVENHIHAALHRQIGRASCRERV